jgi:hypothetical protein
MVAHRAIGRFFMINDLADTAWVSFNDIKASGIVRSRTNLFRYLAREPDQHPFPRPVRHTQTGRRYWRVGQVQTWWDGEQERRAVELESHLLEPDRDPGQWMPGRRRKAEGPNALSTSDRASSPSA